MSEDDASKVTPIRFKLLKWYLSKSEEVMVTLKELEAWSSQEDLGKFQSFISLDFSKVKVANAKLIADGLVKKKVVSTVQLFFLSPKINAQKVRFALKLFLALEDKGGADQNY